MTTSRCFESEARVDYWPKDNGNKPICDWDEIEKLVGQLRSQWDFSRYPQPVRDRTTFNSTANALPLVGPAPSTLLITLSCWFWWHSLSFILCVKSKKVFSTLKITSNISVREPSARISRFVMHCSLVWPNSCKGGLFSAEIPMILSGKK